MTVDEQLQRARDLLDEPRLTAPTSPAGRDISQLRGAIRLLLGAIEHLADRAA